jgi:EAL domain-containing protein (putative c-di-GMP-specific phosphodiesterase class I)
MVAPFSDEMPESTGADAQPASSTADPGASVPARPRILMLDDDPFVLTVQSHMLRSMGYTALRSATAGGAALQLLEGEPACVDLIVCDLNMPHMDGIAFLQSLSASGFRGHVILLSGEGARVMHTVQKLLHGGNLVILGALEKPARPATLRGLLECWKPLGLATPVIRPKLEITQADLHTANREQQWVLHYQPKVELQGGALAGVEALVRWNHPRHGLVAPDHFIGLAETCGAIDALTEWVLREAMQQLALWQGQGLRITMAVNLSTENLHAEGFAQRVGALAAGAGVSPQDIMLEITESRLMSPSSIPLECLVRLRLQKFGLSIDDFGTGHSSLVMLRDVPFTQLKIDRSFVSGARYNQIIRPILDGSVGIAKRMGMELVAEGVETEDDWKLMREIGCEFAQGYFIARPMAADRIPQWLEAWQERRPQLVQA